MDWAEGDSEPVKINTLYNKRDYSQYNNFYSREKLVICIKNLQTLRAHHTDLYIQEGLDGVYWLENNGHF